MVAGVIGIRKFAYDLWGETVNIASRMEAQALPGSIQVAEETYRRLAGSYRLEARAPIRIKGKGMVQTYFLLGREMKE